MEKIYNKLVRDKIPNIIKEKNETPVVKILTDEEYKEELENQTLEDVIEVANKKVDKRGGFEEKIFLEKVIE